MKQQTQTTAAQTAASMNKTPKIMEDQTLQQVLQLQLLKVVLQFQFLKVVRFQLFQTLQLFKLLREQHVLHHVGSSARDAGAEDRWPKPS